MSIRTGVQLYCSFCGKSQFEVETLITGPAVFICNECVEACLAIIVEKGNSLKTKTTQEFLDKQRLLDALKKAQKALLDWKTQEIKRSSSMFEALIAVDEALSSPAQNELGGLEQWIHPSGKE